MKPADLAHQRQAITVDDWLEHNLTRKICTRCHEEKHLDAFGIRKDRATNGHHAKGRMSVCRSCDAARKRAKPA